MARLAPRKLLLMAILLQIAASACLGVVAVVAGLRDDLLAGAAVWGAWCIWLLPILWAVGLRRRPWLFWTSAAASTLTAPVMLVAFIIDGRAGGATAEKLAAFCGVWFMVALCAMLCGLAQLPSFRVWWWNTASVLACVCACAFCLSMCLVISESPIVLDVAIFLGGRRAEMTLVALGIVTAALMVLVAALWWLDRERAGAPDAVDSPDGLRHGVEVAVECPRCRTQCALRSNRRQRCSGCGLDIRVELREPRCACGYLLSNIQAPMCPECGVLLTRDQQWGRGIDPVSETATPSP